MNAAEIEKLMPLLGNLDNDRPWVYYIIKKNGEWELIESEHNSIDFRDCAQPFYSEKRYYRPIRSCYGKAYALSNVKHKLYDEFLLISDIGDMK